MTGARYPRFWKASTSCGGGNPSLAGTRHGSTRNVLRERGEVFVKDRGCPDGRERWRAKTTQQAGDGSFNRAQTQAVELGNPRERVALRQRMKYCALARSQFHRWRGPAHSGSHTGRLYRNINGACRKGLGVGHSFTLTFVCILLSTMQRDCSRR
jgi:hypothetical protein